MAPKKFAFLFVMIVFFAGCAAFPLSTSDVTEVKRIKEPQFPDYRPPKRAEGSLWSEMSGISLFPDRRARKIGDIVIVRIVEDPEAKLNANTSASRSSTINAKLKALGWMQALAEKNSRLAQKPGEDDLINASLSSKSDGKGSSDMDGHVRAYISAVIVRVLLNGNFYINGKREIKVNHETQ